MNHPTRAHDESVTSYADKAVEAGLDPARLKKAFELLASWADSGRVPGSAISVSRNGISLPAKGVGAATCSGLSGRVCPDAVFLVASVTKPLTALAAVILVESGRLALSDRVCDIVPEFEQRGKARVRIVHLLTHTSGLPDMLPENEDLRREHAPLAQFVEHICRCGLLFLPGTQVRYQSMGTAMLGEVVQRLSGRALADFLQEEIFEPLEMASTSLGIRDDLRDRVVDVVIAADQQRTDWHWNSDYWQGFGAPWRGMFSTVDDLTRLLQMFLNQGEGEDGARVLGPAAARVMVTDQIGDMPDLPPGARVSDVWGLGWRVGKWGDLGSPESFSHGGATGTLVGADPRSGLSCAVFTTQPGAPLHYVVNAVQGSLTEAAAK